MAAVTRLVTLVDVQDDVADPRQMSVSALHEAVLEAATTLAASKDPTERWVGKDVLRDITRPLIANNTTHDNSITVGTQTYAFASVFNYSGCTSTQVAPYLNGSKGLTFTNNTYKVPSTSGQYWYWSVFKYWYEWQGLGLDTGGSISQ